MFNIFPYVFSGTFNLLSNSIGLIDNIIDNVINSELMDSLIDGIENSAAPNIDFKEHKRAYTIESYLPGVKKENVDIEYENNYITLKIKRNMFYSNNQNIAVAVIQSGGDIEEDYYVENADPYNIKAVLKDGMLRVIVPKNTHIDKDTTIIDVDNYEIK